MKVCSSAGAAFAVLATGGVESASDSGMISSIRKPNTVSACCQPKLSISATPIGANRN